MQGFKFSPQEYAATYRALMPSTRVLRKQLTVNRVKDGKTCSVAVKGYPMVRPSSRKPTEAAVFYKQAFSASKVAIQVDPLPFLYQARQFALETLPSTAHAFNESQRGIFGDQTPVDESPQGDEGVHSILFPMNLAECEVNLQKLWLVNECHSPEALARVTDLFETGKVLTEHHARSVELIRSIMQTDGSHQEVQEQLLHCLLAGQTVLLCDMPMLVQRMRLAQSYSIDELREIFDRVLNQLVQGRGPVQPRAAA